MTLNINKVAEQIGIEVDGWIANCYAIACACVEAGVVEGTPVYGHFLGTIEDGSPWIGRGNNRMLVQHGWVLLSDGTVFDPTRWQFEVKGPYLFFGEIGDEYDEGGNKFRASLYLTRPIPKYDPDEQQVSVDFKDALPFIRALFHPNEERSKVYSLSQIFYLANMPYEAHGEHVGAVYAALEKANCGGLIPFDNSRRAEREFGKEHSAA